MNPLTGAIIGVANHKAPQELSAATAANGENYYYLFFYHQLILQARDILVVLIVSCGDKIE